MTAKSIETGTGQTEGEGEGTVDTGVSDLEGGETSNINQRDRELSFHSPKASYDLTLCS